MKGRAIRQIVGTLMITTLIVGMTFLAGFGAGRAWPDIVSPPPLSIEPLDTVRVRTVPMTVRVEIEDTVTFESAFPWGYAESARRAAAFARPFIKPCEIHLRAGAVIVADPAHSWAAWEDSREGDTIAHELLHCLRGRWHP